MTTPEGMKSVPPEVEGSTPLTFMESIERRQDAGLYICFGLDPNLKSYEAYLDLPKLDYDDPNGELSDFLLQRNTEYVDAVARFAAVFKPNSGFFERYGLAGVSALEKLVASIHKSYPEIPVIGDVKRGDLANTQEAYAEAAYDRTGFDAATVNPYMSTDAVEPFSKYENKGTYLLVRTSNTSASKTQDAVMADGRPYWQHMADLAVEWNAKGNIGIVVGATNPQELVIAREIVGPDMQILAPGVGSQGATVEDVFFKGNDRVVANVSRSNLYPKLEPGEDYISAVVRVAKNLHEDIQAQRAA